MKENSLTNALDTFITDLTYTEAILKAHEATRSLATGFTHCILQGEEKLILSLHVDQKVERAQAVLDIASEQVDDELRKFSKMVLLYVEGNKDSFDYKRFFTELPSQLVKKPFNLELEYITSKIIPELAKLEDSHTLKPFQTSLSLIVANAQEAQAARLQAQAERNATTNDILQWKIDTNSLRTTTYGQLLQIAMQNKKKKDWVELFYKRNTRRSKKAPNPAE